MPPVATPAEPNPNPSPEGGNRPGGTASFQEPVWTYRGYQLRASEFTTAMAHLFRAEVNRANVWRQRLDTTTNWAVLTTGTALSFTFTQPTGLHIVIPINVVLVTMFWMIEARRYRYYELWSYRVRLMETDFFAAMLVPPFHPSPDWAEALAENLLHPHYPISTWEAIGRRLRRNYLWIYAVIGTAWVAKLWLMPHTALDFSEIVQRASVGNLSGSWVILAGGLFYLGLGILSLATLGLHASAGEVLPRYGNLFETQAANHGTGEPGSAHWRAWFRPTRRRRQALVFIITDRGQEVSQRILKEMSRGVTSLSGKGMFTEKAHSVLMCALTITEIPQIKVLVNSEDPNAFVILSPAQEILGRGFMPLEDDK